MSHSQRSTGDAVGATKSHGDLAPSGDCERGGETAHVGGDCADDGEPSELRLHWHVILIAVLMDFGQSAAFRSSGFIYVALMDHFEVDHEAASWPVSVLGTVVDAGGILAGPLCQWFGAAATLRAGALVTAVGVMASAFAPDIPWMTVTLGVIHGAGAGTVSMMLQVFLSMNFIKYRGTAHGMMFMGSIVSSLVVPQALFFLENTYGFSGCLLVFSALLLHLVPISFLLRPGSPGSTSCQLDTGQSTLVETRDVNLNIKDVPESDSKSCSSSSTSSSTNGKSGVLQSAAEVLRLPMFYVILVTWTVMCYNEDIFLTTIVDFAVDKGFAKNMAVPLLSYLSFTDAIGRIGLPLLADRKILRRSTLVCCNAALTATSVAIIPEANTYAFLVVATLLAACFNGCGMTMHGVLMADYIGMDNLPVGYGVAGILVVPLLLVKPVLIGYFRDTLGSYNDLYRILGGMQLLLFILWLFISYRERRRGSPPGTSHHEQTESSKLKEMRDVSYINDCKHSYINRCFCTEKKNCHSSGALQDCVICEGPWIVNSCKNRSSYPGATKGAREWTEEKCCSLRSVSLAHKKPPVSSLGILNYGSVADSTSKRNSLSP
nr:monocarboxylate transporter 5-like [Rhipicephalus microplus]